MFRSENPYDSGDRSFNVTLNYGEEANRLRIESTFPLQGTSSDWDFTFEGTSLTDFSTGDYARKRKRRENRQTNRGRRSGNSVRPSEEARHPLPTFRQDFMFSEDNKQLVFTSEEDYVPSEDTITPLSTFEEDYVPSEDTITPLSTFEEDYFPSEDIRQPLFAFEDDCAPLEDTRQSLSTLEEDCVSGGMRLSPCASGRASFRSGLRERRRGSSRSLVPGPSAESEDPFDMCPICLSPFGAQKVGKPECCDHIFCVGCIIEWTKRSRTCPVDRKAISKIEIRSQKDSPTERVVRIAVRKHWYLDDVSDMSDESSDDLW